MTEVVFLLQNFKETNLDVFGTHKWFFILSLFERPDTDVELVLVDYSLPVHKLWKSKTFFFFLTHHFLGISKLILVFYKKKKYVFREWKAKAPYDGLTTRTFTSKQNHNYTTESFALWQLKKWTPRSNAEDRHWRPVIPSGSSSSRRSWPCLCYTSDSRSGYSWPNK